MIILGGLVKEISLERGEWVGLGVKRCKKIGQRTIYTDYWEELVRAMG